MLELLLKILPASPTYAHCDVPCGIYDPTPARIAAATCLKMVQKLEALKPPAGGSADLEFAKHHADATRFTWTKEEHARKCKEELLILWTDYFKPEHLEKFPNFHDTFWQAAKLCSKVKQTIDEEAARQLVKSVDEIADIFTQTKATS
jgi:nickel superoxide dismutase